MTRNAIENGLYPAIGEARNQYTLGYVARATTERGLPADLKSRWLVPT